MAGVDGEDEFRDAVDGAGTDPPPSSPPAPTPSKAKPAAAGGGFGRRLLASIGLPTSLSAAIGRSAAPSGPKPPAPQPPVGPNLGLGLLLHQGFNPSADGSLISDASAGNLHLLPNADIQKRHEEGLGEQSAAEDGGDQVIGHDVGVGEELAVLVLTVEEGQEKEDVADGCSGNRNGYSVQEDKEKEEEHKGVELGAAMENQEVMEQKVVTKYYTAVEDQSNNDAEQCTGDSQTAIKDDSTVEEKEAAEQGCSVGTLVAAEDGIAGGLQEDGLVEGQCEDVISVHEQLMVVEASDELRVAMGDCWVYDQEDIVVEQEGETECFDAAVEDQSSNAALEQHDGDEFKDDNVVEDKDKAVEKEGAIGIQCAAEDGIVVRLQKEDVVVEDQGEDGISVQDQVKVVEQCMSDELGATMGDSATHDQEVVVVEEGVTEHFDAAVEDQIDNPALENHTSYELRVIKDSDVVEDKDKAVEQEAAIGTLGAAEDGIAVGLREVDLVVEGQGEHGISVKDQDNMVEQCISDELGVGIGDSAVHDQEVMVEQERLVKCINAAMEDQCNDAAMEQCTSDELREVKSGNVVEEKVNAVEQEGAIGLLVAAADGTSVGEENVLVEGQGEDCISVQDQHKMVDLCMSDELGVAVGGSIIQYHDPVVDLEEVTGYFDAVVEDQTINAAVEQCTHDESKGSNFVEVKEKAVQQEVAIDIFDAAKDHATVKLQKKKVIMVDGQGVGEVSIQYQHKVMEQCTSDDLEVAMGDSTVHDQEVGVEQEGITEHINAVVEDHNNKASMMQCTSDELSDVKDGNIVKKEKALDQEREFGIMGAAENSVAVGLQGESNMVVEGEVEDVISIQDQQNVLEQCTSDEPGVSMCDGVVQDQGVVLEEGVTEHIDAAVEDQSKSSAVEQCTSDELEAAKDDYFLEEKEKMVEEGVIDILGSVKNDATVESQERREMEVLAEQGEDVVSLQDQCMAVEQCASDQVRTITDVNAAHDQVVEQKGVVDGIAIDAQEKTVEQSGGDESIATKDTEDKEQEVDQDGLIHKQDAIKGGSAVELQENEGVTVKVEGEDGISVRDQDKVVEQCTSDQWGTTLDDNAAEDQEVRREKIRLCVGYPQRPGRPNCRVYMSTGRCSYGLSCYLNHPPQLKAMPEVPSFPSEQRNHEVAQILELNRVGLPIRENAKNCTFFMRNGTCKYGKRCCFNHPEHVLDVQLYKPTGWDDTNLPSSPNSKKSSPQSKKASEHVTLDDISSSSEILPPTILRMLLPPQTVPVGSEAKETKTRKDPDWSSASDDSDGCYSGNNSGGPLCKQEHHLDYPERRDRQECPFLLKYGNCKFASSCQYYHPTDKSARKYHQKDPSLAQELMVYPDKPGAPECPFYMKTRACKFGAECKFHHPKDLPPRGPTIPKRLVDANELHPETKTTLQDHMDQQQNYPERPGQPECRYYMQFGKCKFLSACIFHHPKNRVAGMPECPFYMKTGTCQFGSACEFYHLKHRGSSKGGEIDVGTEYVHGYPERPGENECFSYMKHGCCRFQMNCRYHHPADRLSRK